MLKLRGRLKPREVEGWVFQNPLHPDMWEWEVIEHPACGFERTKSEAEAALRAEMDRLCDGVEEVSE